MQACKEIEPQMREVRPNHLVACHLHDPAIAPPGVKKPGKG
jgi:hypothetical protein